MKLIEKVIVAALSAYTHFLEEAPWPVAYVGATIVSLTFMVGIVALWMWLEKTCG